MISSPGVPNRGYRLYQALKAAFKGQLERLHTLEFNELKPQDYLDIYDKSGKSNAVLAAELYSYQIADEPIILVLKNITRLENLLKDPTIDERDIDNIIQHLEKWVSVTYEYGYLENHNYLVKLMHDIGLERYTMNIPTFCVFWDRINSNYFRNSLEFQNYKDEVAKNERRHSLRLQANDISNTEEDSESETGSLDTVLDLARTLYDVMDDIIYAFRQNNHEQLESLKLELNRYCQNLTQEMSNDVFNRGIECLETSEWRLARLFFENIDQKSDVYDDAMSYISECIVNDCQDHPIEGLSPLLKEVEDAFYYAYCVKDSRLASGTYEFIYNNFRKLGVRKNDLNNCSALSESRQSESVKSKKRHSI